MLPADPGVSFERPILLGESQASRQRGEEEEGSLFLQSHVLKKERVRDCLERVGKTFLL